MDYSNRNSYPLVANTDYSPTNDAFTYPDNMDKAYIADSYTSRPDYTFDSFFDADAFFERPVSSIEANYAQKDQPLFNTTLPTATSNTNLNSWSNIDSAPYNRAGNANTAFSNDVTFSPNSFEASCISRQNSSPTPSLCGDGPQPAEPSEPAAAASPSLSPRSLKRESPSDAELNEEPAPKRPLRKRGRPRLDRTASMCESNISSPASSSTCKAQGNGRPSHRLPHNQVERKYREGLNNELERLRKAVPTLPQGEEGIAMGTPKPSKAMVLAGAIEYIKRLERERDGLVDENDRLRGQRMSGMAAMKNW